MASRKQQHRARRRDIRRNRSRNVHHVIPKSRGGQNGDNLVEVDRRIHSAWHRVFSNATPHEAFVYASTEPYHIAQRIIRALVAEFGTGILTEEVLS